ncbi:TAXI family TRAP transporter solute-binding subunit [Pseudosulfitobacter koreensis]|uniref:TAXI family TRAP transporter solute-binding subunit n=1 Tax=Pseudosulfitobacter koreensis TaxID=2968472 RepID=A0ABT1YZM7_9RHOB|nr:TAXI family TRAP transporter solute-binding subunit [Pseudosulfitobacter koreense]MCR8826347.1 TAXI family TRAP transporter solute-binding subunit [Pseudosulfitobacter koreense]
MKTTLSFAVIAAISATMTYAQSANYADLDRTDWPSSFTVGTASQGGTFFVYGSGWANLVGEQLGISGGGEVTGGPMQNMALVHTGDAAFGMTTMGPARESIEGTNPIAPGLQMTNACAMFPMYQTPFSMAALTSSGISSIESIPDGARIGFGPAGSTSDTYFPAMLEALGVNFDRRNGGWDDLGGQLQDGLLDAVAFAVGIPTPAISQIEVQAEVNFIDFTDEERTQVIEEFPVAEYEIPAATYSTLERDMQSVAMWNFAIANCELPESFVYAATDIVMSDNARMMNIHGSAKETLPENWNKNTVMMWHPGAARWFRENAGADIPDDRIYSAN